MKALGIVLALLLSTRSPLVQYSYTPYGEVWAREQFASHTNNRLGHKGLFADRLSGNVNSTQSLAVGEDRLSYARNRHYNPTLGSWMQFDPNGAGAIGASGTRFGGVAGVSESGFVGDDYIADGLNRYGFARNNPIVGVDPLGLEFSLVSLMGASTTTGEMQSDWTDQVLDAGLSATELIQSEFESYAAAQEEMMDAALDWSTDDDFFSYGGEESEDASPASGPTFLRKVSKEWNRNARQINRRGNRAHHMLTWYKTTSRDFRKLFKEHEIKFNFHDVKRNLLELTPEEHGVGRHKSSYHKKVLEFLKARLKGKCKAEAQEALDGALEQLKGLIKNNPEQWFGK